MNREPAPPPFGPAERQAALAALRAGRRVELVVVGGGATGLGIALDAAVRGIEVLLVEGGDFGQGTSSRSTKLLHGGVRYLAQGEIGLVREALHERWTLLAQAPHITGRLAFVVPGYRRWEPGWYGLGLKVYDTLAGGRGIGPTRWLGAAQTLQHLPGVRSQGLIGGVEYWDGQFDDARLAVLLARTAAAHGATVLNRVRLSGLLQSAGRVCGVRLQAAEGGEPIEVEAGCVINATGVWVDEVRAADRAEGGGAAAEVPMVAPSQGVHLVVDRTFLPGERALMVPRTADGRVLFAVPWLGKTVLGTTDTPRPDVVAEPRPFRAEVDFILGEAGRYLQRAPTRVDVRSAWVGLRPLVRPASQTPGATQTLSREHTIVVSPSGLVTITGGKWTTYRSMAEDVLARCMTRGLLAHKPGGQTRQLKLLGAAPGRSLAEPPGEHLYGSEAAWLRTLPGADRVLWRDRESGRPGLTEAMVRFAARHEAAGSVEDVLARRSRVLFLQAEETDLIADVVGAILREELGEGFDAGASAAALKLLAASYRSLP